MEPTVVPTPILIPTTVPIPTAQTAVTSLRQMITDFIARMPYIAVACIAMLLFYLVAQKVGLLVRRISERNKRHRNLGLILERLTQFSIQLLGLLVALMIALPGFTPSRLIEILGLTSVAIGFAFRDILQNFLAGILILLTEPFQIGDQIIFKDFEGTVEDIQTRATMIRTYDGRRVVIPNSELFTNPVLVNTAFARRRLEQALSISHNDDIGTVKGLIIEAVRNVDGVLHDPAPDVLVVDLTPTGIQLMVHWWIKLPVRPGLPDTRDHIITALKQKVYQEGNVDFPYPTQQILVHDEPEEVASSSQPAQHTGWRESVKV